MIGFITLLHKEILRFWKVMFQTLFAPILSALLFQLVFFHTLSDRIVSGFNIPYGTFLIPGLVMMSAIQNAYANSASSLIQARLNGSIVFILLAPFSALEFFLAYLLSSVIRGVLVGLGVIAAIFWFGLSWPTHPIFALSFCLLGCILLGALGILTGILSKSFDQLSAFQNFFIMPLTFLSGTFYSLQSLSPFWQMITYANPLFYTIDGFRYGFFGHADVSPWLSLGVVSLSTILSCLTCLYVIHKGYRLKP